jgi:Phosphoesterase family
VLRRKIVWALAATLVTAVLAGCGGSGNSAGQATGTRAGVTIPAPGSGTRPCGTVGSTTYDHVIWILMENKSYPSVIGSRSAPYETALAHQCASAAHWKDAGSQYDSLPNYIALTTGIPTGDPRLDPFICDCAPASSVKVTVDNLFRQVRAAGLTEKSYAEGMSGNCSNSGTTYAPKHNPALYMWGGSDRQACRADDVPMGSNGSGAFIDDLRAGRLPNFSYIAPNLCHDTHDCGVPAGDAYLKTLIGNILASGLYGQGHTAVVVVWDEDTPVPNLVVSPSVHPGTVVKSKVSHYSLLRATEDIFGLPRLLSASHAPDLRAATVL